MTRSKKRSSVIVFQKESNIIFETYKVIEKKKTSGETKFIYDCLKKHFLFFRLSENQLY